MQIRNRKTKWLAFGLLLAAALLFTPDLVRLVGGRSDAVLADPAGIKYAGSTTCSSTGCHGDTYDKNKADVKLRKEVDVWTKIDPHAKTYSGESGLINEKAKAIATKMNIPDATKDASCLSCHALSGLSTVGRVKRVVLKAEDRGDAVDITEGATCCDCHGPSGDKNDKNKGYFGPHKEKGWTQKQRDTLGAQKLFDTFGLYDTKDMKLRANLCYGCHMIVDPALIAANHPHRPFEANVLYSRYKKTSHFGGDKDAFAETKLWAVGQAISLREAAQELAERAPQNDAAVIAEANRHVLAHALMFRQVLKNDRVVLDQVDKDIAAIQAGLKQPQTLATPLKSLTQSADQQVDKMNATPFDKALADTLLNGVAAEADQASRAGLPAANQYIFALASLWGNLKDPKAEKDEKFTKIKALVKALKATNNESAKYTPDIQAQFAIEAKAVGALFPGGQSLPLAGLPAGAGTSAPTAPVVPPAPPVLPPVVVQAPPAPPPAVQPPPVEPPKITATAQGSPATIIIQITPQKVYEDYSNRPPLPASEYGKHVFCLECGMKWPAGTPFCGRCGRPLPKWENVQPEK